MLDTLIEWDKALLLAINGWNSPFFDEVMFWISDRLVWIPFYVSLIYVLIRSKRFDAIYGLLAVALTVLLADQFASGFCKPFFERLRPTHDPTMQPFVHLVHAPPGAGKTVRGRSSRLAGRKCGEGRLREKFCNP
jgi:undecaprenyl-diphosphatase